MPYGSTPVVIDLYPGRLQTTKPCLTARLKKEKVRSAICKERCIFHEVSPLIKRLLKRLCVCRINRLVGVYCVTPIQTVSSFLDVIELIH